jgi:transcriptional regulator of NAD metabolism
MVKTSAYEIPETQAKYARLKDEGQLTDHKKIVSRHELENMNNQLQSS